MSRVVEYSPVTLVEDYAYLASMSQNESAGGAVTGPEWFLRFQMRKSYAQSVGHTDHSY